MEQVSISPILKTYELGQKSTSSKAMTVFRVTCGNCLEMYDFFLFGFYAPYISRTFFPLQTELGALMLTFLTFGAGFLVRPLGAVFLGGYVDRVGRRKGLIVTLVIMAVGTILIAFVPGYHTIGLLAPMLVLVGRLLQGFSAGAEQGGVSVYLSEIATTETRGFYVSWQSATAQISIMVAAIVGYSLSKAMPSSELAAWGWRVPFVIGSLLVPFLIYLRSSLRETEEFLQRLHRPSIGEVALSLVKNWRIIGLGILLVAPTTIQFYAITVYTPTFGKVVLKLTDSETLLIAFCTALSNLIWLPVMGAVSDMIGRKPILLMFSSLTIVAAYSPLAWLVQHASFVHMLVVLLWLSFIYAGYSGAMLVALTEVVPASVRTSGFSLAYTAATALFGGFTPLASTWLIGQTGNKASLGLCMAFGGVLGLIATILVYRKPK